MRTEIRNKIVCKRRTLAKRWFLATFVRTAWLHRIKWKYTMNFLLTQKNLMLLFCGKGSPLNLCSLNTLRDFIGISLGFFTRQSVHCLDMDDLQSNTHPVFCTHGISKSGWLSRTIEHEQFLHVLGNLAGSAHAVKCRFIDSRSVHGRFKVQPE